MDAAHRIHHLLGEPARIGVHVWDGSTVDPPEAVATLEVRDPRALATVARAPGELGLVRAYVNGDLDVVGDLAEVLQLGFRPDAAVPSPARMLGTLLAGGPPFWRALASSAPPPAIEAHLSGRRHSKRRDRDAVQHHYDVGNDFYALVLGPAMTYSCAVFEHETDTLVEAQTRKHELVATKLGLDDGMRLLDIGCGWGQTLIHAASTRGITGVGVTVSEEQAVAARARVAAAGLADRIDIRLLDYRDVTDEPFDAVCSIGMFEHVGRAGLDVYMRALRRLVRPGGRVLHHAIARPALDDDVTPTPARTTWQRLQVAVGSKAPSRIESPLMDRYVFPDAELHTLGTMIAGLGDAGLEVRHSENLREHYALTLSRWVQNLDEHWTEACALVGAPRARVWKLYMTACVLGFEQHRTEVHQVVATRPSTRRADRYPLHPTHASRPAPDELDRALATIDLREVGAPPA